MNGLLSLSMDQSLPLLKKDAFSALKQESKGIVACKFGGDSLLCACKNCSFLVIVVPLSYLILFKIANGGTKERPGIAGRF